MLTGVQISDEKILIYRKKLLGPEYAEAAKSDLRKEVVGGYGITPRTYFRHTFRNICLTPLPPGDSKYPRKIHVFTEIGISAI